ncbi:MAG: hybrid sensor histidine kinase/response regulator [Actinomycetota bacterium]|nr:hybrid sensor histidine kinase/response regulator [Actinomycetota bacterium]
MGDVSVVEGSGRGADHAGGPVRVLLVEDNPGDARLVQESLAADPDAGFAVDWVDRLEPALERLSRADVDVVLLDLSLPDAHGIEGCIRVAALAPDVPIVVLTGLDDRRMAVEAVQRGAQDYLTKSGLAPEPLVRSIRYAIERARILRGLEDARREQLRVKDQILAHVSHELRTPLSVIRQYLTVLLEGLAGDLADRQRQFLSIVLRNAEQLEAMVNDLVDAARAQEGKLAVEPRSIDIGALVTESVESFRTAAAGKRISLDAEVGDVPPVFADPRRVRQVVANLVSNALKFTPAGGRVRVHVVASDGHFCEVRVTDTGPGLAEQDLPRVFERLYQASDPDLARHGLGLGLFISKELVDRHGGRLWAHGAPGEGATFAFTLPLAEGRSEGEKREAPPTGGRPGR